ncbi:MAG: DegV family protein, partial [Lachnospiraceae bacterium]|nr:DegV family protein [Lachnospiraceae bacterium]
MKKIGIITDSHSSITKEEAERLGVTVLPMPFYIGDECYLEDVTLTRDDFFKYLEEGKTVSTSQPSPEDVMNAWREGL